MKVKMKVNTNFKGQSLKIGDVVDVPNEVGVRWGARKLAVISKKDLAQEGADEDVQELRNADATGGVPSDNDTKPASKPRKTDKKSK